MNLLFRRLSDLERVCSSSWIISIKLHKEVFHCPYELVYIYGINYMVHIQEYTFLLVRLMNISLHFYHSRSTLYKINRFFYSHVKSEPISKLLLFPDSISSQNIIIFVFVPINTQKINLLKLVPLWEKSQFTGILPKSAGNSPTLVISDILLVFLKQKKLIKFILIKK